MVTETPFCMKMLFKLLKSYQGQATQYDKADVPFHAIPNATSKNVFEPMENIYKDASKYFSLFFVPLLDYFCPWMLFTPTITVFSIIESAT